MRKVAKTLVSPKVSSLERMCQYVVGSNPRAVMRVMYENGFLPYDSKQPVNDYLVKHSIQLVKEEGDNGIVKILSVHPDKELILELFGSQKPDLASQTTPASEVSNFTGTEKVAQQIDQARSIAPVYPQQEETLPSTDNGAVIGLIFLFILILVAIW